MHRITFGSQVDGSRLAYLRIFTKTGTVQHIHLDSDSQWKPLSSANIPTANFHRQVIAFAERTKKQNFGVWK